MSDIGFKPKVAISMEFLERFGQLPPEVRQKAKRFVEKFRENPVSKAINYEKIHSARDSKIRTVRIDGGYRAVVVHPPKGDVYTLVWIDKHDEAINWTRNRQFEVNPVEGSFQIIPIEREEAVPEKPAATAVQGLFDSLDDNTLLSFGLPQILLPSVRKIKTRGDFENLMPYLPEEVPEALFWLAEGDSPEEVRAAMNKPATPAEVDTDDFAKALEHPDSKRRFVVDPTPDELERMLEAPLEKWRVFLHPDQERLVMRTFNGPAQALGGAGTGKTVVAMHRARHLARQIGPDEDGKILFTTFTANLARNIQQMLQSLCGDEIERIEVIHLHAWAANFLREHGILFTVAEDKEVAACWDEAISRTGVEEWNPSFIRQEWQAVVQANAIETLQEYLRVPRTGRREKLSRAQRARLWEVFAAYQDAMAQRNWWEWHDVLREARRYLQENRVALPYRAVIVDEAQDFQEEGWRLIRALVPEGPNDIFLVGDAHQRLYGRKVVLTRLGVRIRGRSSRLRINYRTTEQIRDWAVAMLQGLDVDDLDGGIDTQEGYRSLRSGPPPEVRFFATAREEAAFLKETIEAELQQRKPEEICLVACTTALVENYRLLLETAGIQHVVLSKRMDEGMPGVRVATIHRVKGLEFPCMIVAGANEGVIPSRELSHIEDHEAKERCLLYVAATRARDRLVISSWGTPSPYLPNLT